jgi:hypothetical protein
MAEKQTSGSLFGIPYNFKRPSLRRLLLAHWQPGEGMLVEKPFGVGYTLNLANWRSWIIIGIAGLLLSRESGDGDGATSPEDDEPVEVVVED